MGSFDTVEFLSPAATCAEGHPLVGLQTKDLGLEMATYFVHDGIIYSMAKVEKIAPYVKDGRLMMGQYDCHERKHFTGTVLLYDTCRECEPIYVECADRVSSHWSDLVSGQLPWVEFLAEFRDGKLIDLRPKQRQTREEYRARLTTEHGPHVLPDDDRIVKLALEAWRKEQAARARE